MELLGDRIAVKTIIEEKIGNIFIPETVKQGHVAVVKAVGTGREDSEGNTIPLSVEVGDFVILNPHLSRGSLELDGEKLLVIKEEEIYAVVKAKKEG